MFKNSREIQARKIYKMIVQLDRASSSQRVYSQEKDTEYCFRNKSLKVPFKGLLWK